MTMHPMTPLRLLVPLDGSPLGDQAIPYAAALARPDDDVHLLHVAPVPEPPPAPRGIVGVMTEVFREVGSATAGIDVVEPHVTDQDLARQEQVASHVTQTAADRWKSLIPHSQQHVALGDPAAQILQTAAEMHAELIVLASHGRGALGRWRFGSVADRIARSSPVPVLIIRPQDAREGLGPGEIHRFVVTLDGSPLAAQALPVVRRLVAHVHKPVRLISVVPGGHRPLDTGEAQTDAVTQYLAGAAAELAEAGLAVTWTVERGDPFQRITEAIRQGDVLVCASHGRTGLSRWALGSLAEKLIRLADVPTLVVRTTPAAPA